MRWFPHPPLDTSGFDLCIIYHQYPLMQLVWQLDGLPVVFIGLQKPRSEEPLEYIPMDQLSAFTLENAIRLLFRAVTSSVTHSTTHSGTKSITSSGDRPPTQSPLPIANTTIDDVEIILSPDQKIIAWNQAAENLYGYSETMVQGENYPLLFSPPGDRQAFMQDCQQVLQGKTITKHPHEIVAKDGAIHHLVWRMTPLKENEQTISGVVCWGQAISPEVVKHPDIKNNLNLELDFSETLAQLQVGIAWFSCAGYLLQMNPVFLEMLGYTAAELDKVHLVDLLAVDDATLTLAILRDIAEGKRRTFRCELPYLKAQGDRCWLETTFTAVKSQAIVRQLK
jgi:PAS domain S-box-containing protein